MTIRLTFALAVLLTASAPAPANASVVRWPSEASRTLQSAVDDAPDGSIIEIAPGLHSIETAIAINGKTLTFRGSGDPTELSGPDPQPVVDDRGEVTLRGDAVTGMFNVTNANVTVENLQLTGFDAAILIKDLDRGRPSTLGVDHVRIARTGRGILAYTHGRMAINNTSIEAARWNGISIVAPIGRAHVNLSAVEVHDVGGAGIYFANTLAVMGKVHVSFCFGAGGIVGVNSSAWILDSTLQLNSTAGIFLTGCHSVLTNNDIGESIPVKGLLGDGIDFMNSDGKLTGNSIHDNGRAALGIFGGFALLKDNTMTCNSFDIEVESSNIPGDVGDAGGNECGCGQPANCERLSMGLSAPSPAVE